MDKEKMDELKNAKKMNWYTSIVHRVNAEDAIVDAGTKVVAENMKPRIAKLNDLGMFAIEEGNVIVITQIHDEVYGCSCEKFSKSTSSRVLCRHLIHLRSLIDAKKIPQLLISSPDCRAMRAYLIETGWSVMDRMLYPHLDSPTSQSQPEVVKELPPLEKDTSVDESGDLPADEESWKPDEATPIDEKGKAPEKEPAKEPKIITRRCQFCGHVAHGTDAAEVKAEISEHRENCKDNPKNKPEASKPMEPEKQEPKEPEQEEPEKQELGHSVNTFSGKKGAHPPPNETKPKAIEMPSAKCQFCGKLIKRRLEADLQKAIEAHEKTCSKNEAPVHDPQKVSMYDWLNDLIEFAVCQIYGNSGDGKTALCRAIAVEVADEGKKVVYWDTEGNITRRQREELESHKNITYILCRDWNEIRHMLLIEGEDDAKAGKSKYTNTPKLSKCDVAIIDSIGVPVLGKWGDMKQNEQGTALQQMQGLVYRLTIWAEKNESIVILTNQPVSAMNKTKAQLTNLPPFGDKMRYFTKVILKIVIGNTTDFATICKLLTWRTRDAVSGKAIATITISDNGVEVTPVKRTR